MVDKRRYKERPQELGGAGRDVNAAGSNTRDTDDLGGAGRGDDDSGSYTIDTHDLGGVGRYNDADSNIENIITSHEEVKDNGALGHCG